MIGTNLEIGGIIIVGLGIGTMLAAKFRTDKRGRREEYEYDDEPESWDTVFNGPDPDPYDESQYDEWYRRPAIFWQQQREEQHVPKVTDIPEVLMYGDKPVTEGQILPVGNDGKRQVKIIDPKPDKNGGIMVQENYYVDAGDIGCVIQPETVVMELSPDEARAILKFYDEALKRNTGQQPAVGDSTSQFASPVFEQIGKTLGRT